MRTFYLLFVMLILITGTEIAIGQTQADLGTRILVENCVSCHSGVKPKGGLDLSTRDKLNTGGDNGAGLGVAKYQNGQLWQVLKEGRMPPKKNLNKSDTTILQNWVIAGAKYPSAKPCISADAPRRLAP